MKEIRKIIAEYDAMDHSVEKLALASVVNVEASSYRRIGARMLVRSTGVWTGGISGGCLEGDALKRSQKAIFKNAASNVVYDTMEDDKNQIGIGLGCNGRIEVLFTPIDPNDPDNEIEQLRKIIDASEPKLLLKIIECPEDSPLLGKIKLLDNTEGEIEFAKINETELRQFTEETRERKKPGIYNCKSADLEVKLLVEFIRPETKLIIVGDNYDVLSMVNMATELGWKTTVIGKAKKLSKAVFALSEQVLDYREASSVLVNEYTAVVLMSHDFNHDKSLLPIFLEKRPAYIGMLGPKKRFTKMMSQLPDLDMSKVDFFYSPTGLEIGAESPEEIALSILAEIVAAMRNKKGGFLRELEGSIHG